MFDVWIQLVRSNLLAAILLCTGIIFIGMGTSNLLPEFQADSKPIDDIKVEQNISKPISPSQANSSPTAYIAIDVQGAVINPGLYTLTPEARISDALQAAGEIAETADKVWVARNLNRATKLNDGDKVYIPKIGEVKQLQPNPISDTLNKITNSPTVLGHSTSQHTLLPNSNAPNPTASEETKSKEGKISINTASKDELDSLEGIGEKRAQDIINNRPYTSTEELISKKVIFKSTYEKIKQDITI